MPTAANTYNVAASRKPDGTWGLHVTHAHNKTNIALEVRRLEKAPKAVQEAVASQYKVVAEDVGVRLSVVDLDDDLSSMLEEALAVGEKIQQFRKAEAEASQVRAEAIEKLVNELGWTIQEVGTLFEMSHQRVSQILKPKRG
jgi:hypothetical protein